MRFLDVHVKFKMGSPIDEQPIFTTTSSSLRRNNFKVFYSQILHTVALKNVYSHFPDCCNTQFDMYFLLNKTRIYKLNVFFATWRYLLTESDEIFRGYTTSTYYIDKFWDLVRFRSLKKWYWSNSYRRNSYHWIHTTKVIPC